MYDTTAKEIRALLLLFADTDREIAKMGPDWTLGREFLDDFAQKRIAPLDFRASRVNKARYTISLVGLTNVGKSTLTQALLGEAIAPRENAPATAVPIEYEYGDRWSVIVHSAETQAVCKNNFDGPGEVARFLRAAAVDVSSEQMRVPSCIIVRGPIDLLKETQLVFADTPGFGAAQTGDAEGTHEKKLHSYLDKHVDEVYFCVDGANWDANKGVVDFFEKIAPRCTTVVVTRWDPTPKDKMSRKDMTPAEECDAVNMYKKKFDRLFPLRCFIFTEAKQAISAVHAGDLEGNEQSGLPDLHEMIRRHAHAHERMKSLQADLTNAVSDLPERFARIMPGEKIPWHPSTLARVRKILPDEIIASLT